MDQQDFALSEIEGVFAEQVAEAGGEITGRHALRSRLFLRALLPRKAEVFPDDAIKAGIALRANGTQLQITPYLFRIICGNGLIWEHHLESRLFAVELVFEQRAEFVNLVRECAADQVFRAAIGQLQTARQEGLDPLRAMVLLSRLTRSVDEPRPRSSLSEFEMFEILDRFQIERDTTRYGLVNAVTSLARDTQDHSDRWRLESLGGTIAKFQQPVGRRFHDAASVLDALPDESFEPCFGQEAEIAVKD